MCRDSSQQGRRSHRSATLCRAAREGWRQSCGKSAAASHYTTPGCTAIRTSYRPYTPSEADPASLYCRRDELTFPLRKQTVHVSYLWLHFFSSVNKPLLHNNRLLNVYLRLSTTIHPLFAALHSKVASKMTAPVEMLRHVVVSTVPARIFHQRESDARVHRILCVGPSHRLVL